MPHAVVTGANRGIGLELAAQLAAAGWSVTGLCRQSSDRLSEVADTVWDGIDVTGRLDREDDVGYIDDVGDAPLRNYEAVRSRGLSSGRFVSDAQGIRQVEGGGPGLERGRGQVREGRTGDAPEVGGQPTAPEQEARL